jgi:hypothetical protein
MGSYWRYAGLNFAQYMQAANSAARQCIKPEFATKYKTRESFNYNHIVWADRKKVSATTFSSFPKKD